MKKTFDGTTSQISLIYFNRRDFFSGFRITHIISENSEVINTDDPFESSVYDDLINCENSQEIQKVIDNLLLNKEIDDLLLKKSNR